MLDEGCLENMKMDFEKKSNLVAFISICKGSISKLEEEMKKVNFQYEDHIEMQNEEGLEGDLKSSQMMRNLVENFSRKRAEEVCREEIKIWEKRSIKNKGTTYIYKNDNNKKLILTATIIGTVILLTLALISGQN